MQINTESVFGIHTLALKLRSQRAEILAANLANADTPQFKARDIDFYSTLQAIGDPATETSMQLKVTNPRHISITPDGADVSADVHEKLLYRLPFQPSMDGNTVDSQKEHTEFLENSLRYESSLMFLNSRIKTLMSAIKGQ